MGFGVMHSDAPEGWMSTFTWCFLALSHRRYDSAPLLVR